MYRADGITLNGSEFDTLRALAEADDPKALANELLDSDADRYREVMVGLKRAGLVSGLAASNGFVFIQLNESGRAFVRDYDAAVEAEREAEERRRREIEDQKRHDYKVALFSLLGGAISGGLVTLALRLLFGL